MAEFQKIHEAGAERHGSAWLQANLRTVETTLGTKLRADNRDMKLVLSKIVLKILDGLRIDAGERWDETSKRWVKR